MHRQAGKTMNPHSRVGLPPGSLIPVGVRRTEPVKIRLIRYNQKDFEEKEATSIAACLLPEDRGLITWISIDELQDAIIVEQIGVHFHIHPLVLGPHYIYSHYLFDRCVRNEFQGHAGPGFAVRLSGVPHPHGLRRDLPAHLFQEKTGFKNDAFDHRILKEKEEWILILKK